MGDDGLVNQRYDYTVDRLGSMPLLMHNHMDRERIFNSALLDICIANACSAEIPISYRCMLQWTAQSWLKVKADIAGGHRDEGNDTVRSVQSCFVQRPPLCFTHTAECCRLAVLIVVTMQLSDRNSVDSMCSPLASMIAYNLMLYTQSQRLACP